MKQNELGTCARYVRDENCTGRANFSRKTWKEGGIWCKEDNSKWNVTTGILCVG